MKQPAQSMFEADRAGTAVGTAPPRQWQDVALLDQRAASAGRQMLSAAIGDSPRPGLQRALSERIHAGPRMLAQRRLMQRIGHAPVAQRAGAATPAEAPRAGGGTRFIVEDGAACGPGQSTRGAFLAALEAEVRQMAAQVLARIGQHPDDCPYIAYWFGYYADKDAAHIEEAIGRYAPATATLADWQASLAQVIRQVRQGFEAHVATGSLVGVPAELPKDLHRDAPGLAKPAVQRKADVVQLCATKDETVSDVEEVRFEHISGKRPPPLEWAEMSERSSGADAAPLWSHLKGTEPAQMRDFWEASPDHRAPIIELLRNPDNEAKLSTLQYIFEALDRPRHRQANFSRAVAQWLEWRAIESDDGVGRDFFAWYNLQPVKGRVTTTDYRDEAQRAGSVITFPGGRLYQSGAALSAQDWPVVMSRNNHFYAAEKGPGGAGMVQHSTFMSGLPVKSAGSMTVAAGVLTRLSNHSGHYAPTMWHLAEMANGFAVNNVPMGNVLFQPMESGREYLGTSALYEAIQNAAEPPARQP